MRLYYGLAFLLAVSAPLGCGMFKKKKSTSEPATTPVVASTQYTMGAISSVYLTQSFDANTPKGFKSTSNLNLDAAGDSCASLYGHGTDKEIACTTMADIKDRFFGASPTNIHNLLNNLDSRLNGLLERYSSLYTPCLDATRTTSGTFPLAIAGGAQNLTFPPFALLSVPLKTTFKNGLSFDTGSTLNLSCREDIGSGTSAIHLGYGYKDGTWSLFEAQRDSGIFGTADKDDNIEVWFSIGDPTRDTLQDAVEVVGKNAYSVYTGSTGIAQVISKPGLGLMGISLMGAGVGPGCGSQLLMNNSTLYFEGNVNNYGSCTTDDFVVTGTSYDPSPRADVKVCMNVNGTTITPTENLDACVESGLLSKDTSDAIISPFSSTGLKYLTSDLNSTVSGALKGKAWMGSFFMQDSDISTVQQGGGVVMGLADSVEVTGYSHGGWELLRTTAAENEKTSVAAKCNADAATRQATMNETYELTVAKIIADTPRDPNAKIDGKSITDDMHVTLLLKSLNEALSQTGSIAPSVSIAVSGSKGATYSGTFSGTASVQVDGTEVGHSTLALPGSNGIMQNTADVILNGASLTTTSKITLTLTGTLTLDCENPIDTTRTVGVKPGLPHLSWYFKKPATTTQ